MNDLLIWLKLGSFVHWIIENLETPATILHDLSKKNFFNVMIYFLHKQADVFVVFGSMYKTFLSVINECS